MDDKTKYTQWAARWFDGGLSGSEEQELKAYLSGSDDPDFDEIKAVLGYLSIGRAASRRRKAPIWRPIAASVAAILTAGALATLPGNRHGELCVSYIEGRKITDEHLVVRQMEDELSDFFSADPAPDKTLNTFFGR